MKPPLGPAEKDALSFFLKYGQDIKKFAQRRGITPDRAYKIRQQLVSKGYITLAKYRQQKKGQTPRQYLKGDNKNVHAQRWVAHVHYMESRYKRQPNQSYKNFVPGVDVETKGKTILLRSNGHRFRARTEEKAVWKSMDFWMRVLDKLARRTGAHCMKEGAMALQSVYYEVETQESVVARDAEKKGVRWEVYHENDGKLRLTTDFSEKVPCHETHHPEDALTDSMTFNKQMNAILRHPECPTLPDLARSHSMVVNEVREIGAALKTMLKPPTPPEPLDPVDRPDYVG